MASEMASCFLRVRLLEAVLEQSKTSELYCAINIKEVNEHGAIVQKKKTFYPEWNRCFDSHVVEGRRMQIIVNDKPETPLAEVTIELNTLAEECKDDSEVGNAVKLAVSFTHAYYIKELSIVTFVCLFIGNEGEI